MIYKKLSVFAEGFIKQFRRTFCYTSQSCDAKTLQPAGSTTGNHPEVCNRGVIPQGFPKGMYNATLDKEENGIGKRIAAARKLKGITAQQLCDELENFGIFVSRPALGKWERGESVPSAYQLMAVFFALDVDDPYSFSGLEKKPAVLNEQGLQKLEDYKADLIASGKYRPYRPAESKCKIIEMPVCSLRASAGTGSFLDEGGFENISVIAAQVPAGADFGIYISGDSMEPFFHDGNIAWVHECKELSVGEVGIFTYDGNGYIKE